MTAKESWTKILWVIIHDLLAHPICALFWITGSSKIGDWLHEITLHPLNYNDEVWNLPKKKVPFVPKRW